MKSLIMINVRSSSYGWSSSGPCNNCIDSMKKINIKKVLYYDEKGNWKIEKLKDMKYQHQSMGWKCTSCIL